MAKYHVQISVFDKGFVDAPFVKPLTTSSSRVYKPYFFTPLKISFDPFMTLRILFSPWKTYPFLSNSPREIKFLFKSGTYLTSINNLIDSSWSLTSHIQHLKSCKLYCFPAIHINHLDHIIPR